MTNLTLIHEIAENTKEGARALAMNFAGNDADFCGENGDEYLWVEAKGFESNAEYAWSVAENEATPTEMLKKFFALWLVGDSYYSNYDWNIIEDGDKLSVALCFTVED